MTDTSLFMKVVYGMLPFKVDWLIRDEGLIEGYYFQIQLFSLSYMRGYLCQSGIFMKTVSHCESGF